MPGIFAAGDVARALQPETGRHVRFESYGAAQEQGTTAGKRLAGLEASPCVLGGAGSQQFGTRMQLVGSAEDAERVIVRGSLAERSFAAFFAAQDEIRGAFVMNRMRELPAIRALVRARARVDGARPDPLEAAMR